MVNVLIYCRHWNKFWWIPPEQVEKLIASFPRLNFIVANDQEEFEKALPEADICLTYSIDQKGLEKAYRLKWIHVPAANVYQFTSLPLDKRNIVLTNSRGVHGVPIAEHVIGCMILFSRRFMDCREMQLARHYGQEDLLKEIPPLTVLRGKTIVILGLGSIGKEIARLAASFGMRVVATKRDVSGSYENIDLLYPASDFRLALPEADFLVIAMPRTAETDDLIGQLEFNLLKPNCVLINIARAKIVDQEALLKALKERSIRGAALDVFEKEPLPADSGLYSLPNVFLTPHVSGVDPENHWPRMMELFQKNLNLFLNGKPLINVVDLQRGY